MKRIIALLVVSLIFAACSEKNGSTNEPENPYASKLVPLITRIDPYPVKAGKSHSFYGYNFGKYQPGNCVIFDSLYITNFDSWSDGCITLTFPQLETNGTVRVKAHSLFSEGFKYTITRQRDSAEIANTLKACNVMIVIRTNPRSKTGVDTLKYTYNPTGYGPEGLSLYFAASSLDYTMFSDPWYIDSTDLGPECPKSYYIVTATPYYKSIPLYFLSIDKAIFSKTGYIGILDTWEKGEEKLWGHSGYYCVPTSGFRLSDINGSISIIFKKE